MPKKPFDDLSVLNDLIRKYKDGNSTMRLSSIFKCQRNTVREALIFAGLLTGKPKERIQTSEVRPLGKYDHLIFEPINTGSNYDVLCKKHNVKIFKGAIFLSRKDLDRYKNKPPKEVVGDCD